MYSILRPILFSLEAEKAHALCLNALHYLPQCFLPKTEVKPVHALGLSFPHCVGLAAGLDKNAEHLHALAKIGFSFIEVGTVTPRPQIGNPKPRLFRVPKANALINRMGFNNKGVDYLVENIKKTNYKGILGVNIGKNKETSLENATADYTDCLKKVYKYASYVTINISSPNTPDLRQLHKTEFFEHLLAQLRQEQIKLSHQYQRHVPLLVKVSPDEHFETLKKMAEVILKYKVEGLIATNTTCSRRGVNHLPYGEETGGLSGSPLLNLSTECLRILKQYIGTDILLIGVGGIDDIESAQSKLDAGASLVQVYTGLIYRGPQLVSQLVNGLKYDASIMN